MLLDTIVNLDCLEFLHSLEEDSVDLIVTSPPYNKEHYNKHKSGYTKWDAFRTKCRAVNYGYSSDDMKPDLYAKWQTNVISECLRVLKPAGSLIYNHKDLLFNRRVVHPIWVYDFNVREVLIWNRRNTPTIDSGYFYPIHEYIYWITKSRNVKFDRNKIPLEVRKSIITMTKALNNRHPAPFPLELPDIFIEAFTDEGDIVCDPFMGSGTTALAAKKKKQTLYWERT